MAPIGKIDTFPGTALVEFKKTHPSAGKCVYQDALYELYWQDDAKTGNVLLLPAGANSYDAFKVELVKQKQLRETDGKRNGKPFHSAKIEDGK